MITIKEECLDWYVSCPFTSQHVYLRFLDGNLYNAYSKKYPDLFNISDDTTQNLIENEEENINS